MNRQLTQRKPVIIGVRIIGHTIVLALMFSDSFSQIVFIDLNKTQCICVKDRTAVIKERLSVKSKIREILCRLGLLFRKPKQQIYE